MELTKELIQKHKDRILSLLEATVKSHTRTSKTGKVFNVKQHDREEDELRAKLKTAEKRANASDSEILVAAKVGGRIPELGLPDSKFLDRYRADAEAEVRTLRFQLRKYRSTRKKEKAAENKEYGYTIGDQSIKFGGKKKVSEARVKAHTRRSKTGKSYQVKDFERKGDKKKESYWDRIRRLKKKALEKGGGKDERTFGVGKKRKEKTEDEKIQSRLDKGKSPPKSILGDDGKRPNGPNVLGSKLSKWRTTKTGALVTDRIAAKIKHVNWKMDNADKQDRFEKLKLAKDRLVKALKARGIKVKTRRKREKPYINPMTD